MARPRSTTRCNLCAPLLALAASAAACAPGVVGPPTPERVVVFPPPPDTARIQFLTRISSSADLVRTRPTFWQRLIGQKPEPAYAVAKPYGIAIHAGKIYVCDTAAGVVEVIDLANHKWSYIAPRSRERFGQPVNCFVDAAGVLYVTDIGQGQVLMFGDGGELLGKLNVGEQSRPSDVFVSEDRIWVTDLATAQVRVYDKASHEPRLTFPDAQRGSPEALVAPVNLHVDRDEVYVSDLFGARVKVYSLDGKYRRSIGSFGDAMGQFARPKGVAVDRDGTLYVVDAAFENVQMFNRDGKLLMFFGGPYQQPGDMALPAGITIDYDNLAYFQKYVHQGFDLKYLILVTNQYGPDKISVYGFVGPTDAAAVVRR